MGMMEAVKSVFSQYATFSGRARRSEYWYFVLFNLLVSFALAFVGNLIGGRNGQFGRTLSSLYTLAVFVPGLAVCWRRLHDIGKSGGYYFIVLIPLVGWILLIVWLCQDSVPGSNQCGPNPKGVGNVRGYADGNIQDYVFLDCPQCGSNLRLARGAGNVIVRCPNCGSTFNANT